MRSENSNSIGYEKRDANARALLIFAAGLIAILALILILMVVMFRYFSVAQSLGPPASPFAAERVLPPPPRLQADPREDLQRLREQENANLNSYGWVNPSAGIVKMPIDRAMDRLIQKGLPVQAEAAEKK
ncbi:MAG: hypothetical protein HYX72_08150 [Acidobacteria bacterium]|nr:hypothetical protein [Acidobacteriota bacterium]